MIMLPKDLERKHHKIKEENDRNGLGNGYQSNNG